MNKNLKARIGISGNDKNLGMNRKTAELSFNVLSVNKTNTKMLQTEYDLLKWFPTNTLIYKSTDIATNSQKTYNKQILPGNTEIETCTYTKMIFW